MIKKIVFLILGLIAVLVISLWLIGPVNAMLWITKPHHSFNEDERISPPDYSDPKNWAAHPDIDDLSDSRPEGVEKDTLLEQVDVFFIHPTGFLRGSHWNSMMDPSSATEENTQWMMINQASCFSDANVYAPRYREATIYSFFDLEGEDEQSALQLAYDDVARAFDYYISNENQGKPFVIASHSQGSFHGLKLLKNKIDGTPLLKRLVAAYIIGMSTVTRKAVDELKDIFVCNQATETGCIIHWATFAEGSPVNPGWGASMICVNPLNWSYNGGHETADRHKGYVLSSGEFNLRFAGKDEAGGTIFMPLDPPIVGHTFARCEEGRLLVKPIEGASEAMGEGNYHGYDYQLFHMDIRQNLSDRTRAYFQLRGETL